MLFSEEASFIKLPILDLLATFILKPGYQLHLSGCDTSQYYTRIAVPGFLIPLLGMPRVRASLVKTDLYFSYVIPYLRYVPMGASLAVEQAQTVTRAVLHSEVFPTPAKLSNVLYHEISDEGVRLPYIDDQHVRLAPPLCQSFYQAHRFTFKSVRSSDR